MSRSLFISHVYEDLSARDSLLKWAESGRLGDSVVAAGESKDVRHLGHQAILDELNPKLHGASAVVVLIGNDTHNHHWVEHEASYALNVNKVVVAVRIPQTSGAPPPCLRDQTLVVFEPDAIRRALGW